MSSVERIRFDTPFTVATIADIVVTEPNKQPSKESMKLIEKTPIILRCGVGPCPAVFENEAGNLVIIGRRLTDEEVTTHLSGRVNSDETVIEIPAAFFSELSAQK